MDLKNFYDHDYTDRGMKKWAGFILAEHAQAETTAKQQRTQSYPAKPQLTNTKITEVLEQAWRKQIPVAIQLEALDEQGSYYPDIVGHIDGYDSLGIYIAQQKVGYDEIRHAALHPLTKWSATENLTSTHTARTQKPL